MKGNEAYENKNKNRIENIIFNNEDKPYLRGFYNYMSIAGTAYSSMYKYIKCVENFMNFNKKNVNDLELDDYTNFLFQIKDKTSSYQIQSYSALKSFSTYLKTSKKNEDNPMNYIKRPKFIETEETIKKREKGYLEKREIKKCLNEVRNGSGNSRAIKRQKKWKERDLLIILIFLSTGIRCSALFKLDINSIDIENRTLIVSDKGKKIQEHILSEELIEHVKDWLRRRSEILDGIEEDALFISCQKKRMSDVAISNIVKKYTSSIEGKNITPHKLRATYGTQLIKETGDIYFVQQQMGHSNPKMTELYIRGQKNINKEKAANIISKIIF